MKKKNKSKSKGKGGCGKSTLLLLCIGIAIILVTVFVVFANSDEEYSQDEKFVELINRQYNQSAFSNEITDADLTSFHNKIRNSVKGNSNLFLSNNTLNTSVFFSNEVSFTNTLSLNNNEIAVFYNYVIQTLLMNEYQDDFAISIYQLYFATTETTVSYSAKFYINVSEISAILPIFLGDNMPTQIFLTLGAERDIYTGNTSNVTVQINQLTGEDNQYCIDKILDSLGLENETLQELGNSPFEFLKNQAQDWGVWVRYLDNQIVLN